MALHNKTNPHLTLKKILLKLWSFRDQLEALLEHNGHFNTLEKAEELLGLYNSMGVLSEYFPTPELSKRIEEQGLVLRPNLEKERCTTGTMFLTDINMSTLLFFSREAFLPGQSILVEFQIPQRYLFTAQVLECKNYNLGARIISGNRPKFRLYAKFSFSRKGEMTLLRRFLQSVSPFEVPMGDPVNPPAAAEEEIPEVAPIEEVPENPDAASPMMNEKQAAAEREMAAMAQGTPGGSMFDTPAEEKAKTNQSQEDIDNLLSSLVA